MKTYALELEGGYWYVGKSINIDRRIRRHFSGKGSKWTQLHKPIRVWAVFDGDVEASLCHIFKQAHGRWNVRGSGWTRTDLTCPDT